MTTCGLWLVHGSITTIIPDKGVETHDSYNGSVTDMPTASMDEIDAAISLNTLDPLGIGRVTCCDHWLGEGYQQYMTAMDALMLA